MSALIRPRLRWIGARAASTCGPPPDLGLERVEIHAQAGQRTAHVVSDRTHERSQPDEGRVVCGPALHPDDLRGVEDQDHHARSLDVARLRNRTDFDDG